MSALVRYLPLLLLAGAWELSARLGLVSTLALPPLSDVVAAWVDMIRSGELITNGASSLWRAGAGLAVPPTDEEAFLVAGKQLLVDDSMRHAAGRRARAYAEATFDTDRITDRFETVIERAVTRRGVAPSFRKES